MAFDAGQFGHSVLAAAAAAAGHSEQLLAAAAEAGHSPAAQLPLSAQLSLQVLALSQQEASLLQDSPEQVFAATSLLQPEQLLFAAVALLQEPPEQLFAATSLLQEPLLQELAHEPSLQLDTAATSAFLAPQQEEQPLGASKFV